MSRIWTNHRPPSSTIGPRRTARQRSSARHASPWGSAGSGVSPSRRSRRRTGGRTTPGARARGVARPNGPEVRATPEALAGSNREEIDNDEYRDLAEVLHGFRHLALARRAAPHCVFQALVEQRRANTCETLSKDEVFEVGWPGETVHPDSARARVYTAIRTLREFGRRDILLTRGGGYLLDPEVPVIVDE